MSKLVKGDEQFCAFGLLAQMIGADCSESSAYALEAFSTEYYVNGETLIMSLAFAKESFLEMGGEIKLDKLKRVK